MMKVIVFVTSFLCMVSCVSSKYQTLEQEYASLKSENEKLLQRNQSLKKINTDVSSISKKMKTDYFDAIAQRDKMRNDYIAKKASYDNLKASYDVLVANSSSTIAETTQTNKDLNEKLVLREQQLAAENDRLKKLKKELEERSKRAIELEDLIKAKDAEMKQLKEAISNALIDFTDKGLTVKQRDGKVYVSMKNRLLFKSGSWSVQKEGKIAVNQLATVLGNNPDISVLIEGHTDNVPYAGKGQVKNNWDLSTKRATTIVAILMKNPKVNPKNLTAAGRSEFSPIASNDTEGGKAKNRRIEVILTPKLNEVTKILNQD